MFFIVILLLGMILSVKKLSSFKFYPCMAWAAEICRQILHIKFISLVRILLVLLLCHVSGKN